MIHAERCPRPRSQQGLVLLALLAILLAVVLYVVVGHLDATALKLRQDETTARALAQAKDALLARATLDGNRPGSLPCPDTDGDGIANLLAGQHCPSYLGRLPWRTLGIGEVRDGAGELLWYALSPTFRDDDSAQPIYTATVGNLSLDGISDVAAIIFAPGAPAPGQTGRPSNAVDQYLESDNAGGDTSYVSMSQAADVNDRSLMISRGELMQSVSRRVTRELGQAVGHYYDEHATLPCAATVDGTPQPDLLSGLFPYSDSDLDFDAATLAWLQSNQWFTVVQYSVNGCAPNSGNIATIQSDAVTNAFKFP